MTDSSTGGRGRTLTLAASAVLVALGVIVLVWAVLSQQGDPPTPDGSAGLSTIQQDAEIQQDTEPGPDAGAGTEPTSAPPETPAPDAATATRGVDAATETAPGRAAPEPAEPAAPEPAEAEPAMQALPPSEPVSIDIPGIDVTSDLHPLGLNEDGTLAVPSGELYDQAAWYDGSPTPGEVGPSVIEGHVTSQGSVPSVFFELGAMEVGDLVEVDREDGTTATFEVYAIDSFPKDDFPKVAVYGNTDVPELRLITCGGEYDPEARAHVDNIVVFARMVPSA